MSGGLAAEALASGPPLAADGWALGERGLELLLAELDSGRERVVECGSGRSTVVVARRLAALGRGTVHALEHDPGWAARTREALRSEGLAERATVIEAPLEPDPVAAPDCRWYSRSALDRLPESGVDLLLVDGPPASPGSGRERSRYPALPRLAARLAAGATVIVDDAERSGERWALDRWQREHGLSLELDEARVALARWPGG